MASIRKMKTGYRAELCVAGVRQSRMFDTRAEAKAWAAEQETVMRTTKLQPAGKMLVRDLLNRYAREVTPSKRGAHWESLRLAAMSALPVAAVQLSEVTELHIAQWRDDRAQKVQAGTVRREMVLLSHVFEVARKEWKLIASNPCKDVRRPKAPPHRDRRITDDEAEKICFALGWDQCAPVTQSRHRVAVAFLFAIETAMRAGEICGIRPEHIVGRTVLLPMTKNGKPRTVPLSSRAMELLGLLPDGYFDLKPPTLDALFRRGRDIAEIENLTFHDTRHEAITRLASVFNPLELARVVGHSNLSQLLVYYNATAEDLAGRLG